MIWRAAVGGVLGAPIFLGGMIVRDLVVKGQVPYGGGLEILGLPVFLFFGVVTGALIGFVLWVLVATTGISFRAIVRAVIGICLLLLVHFIINGFHAASGAATPSSAEAFTNMLLYCGSFGALPAVAAGPGVRKTESQL